MRLADFLGVTCEPLEMPDVAGQHVAFLRSALPNSDSCLALNPSVWEDWAAGNCLSLELVSFLRTTYRYLLVYATRPRDFHSNFVAALSEGQLRGVKKLQGSAVSYEISPDSQDICESFSGLSFGPASQLNDHVFLCMQNSAAQKLILIDGETFMAALRREESSIFFIGSDDVVDLDARLDNGWLLRNFSRLLPYAMALRHIFGEECWRPVEKHASVIVDDPLLRRNYGFLNFERLLGMMQEHYFQTTVAFIPYNFRRSSRSVAKMFRQNGAHLSLCFHGNDHTDAEFAGCDKIKLNTMLQTAEQRMQRHQELTGIHCDRVMVFPQGKFSIEAMAALKSRSFDAAVNTMPNPWGQEGTNLTISDLAHPAILRYAGYPLFLRMSCENTQEVNIAFNLFFGKPILIVEHHDIFKNEQRIIDVVTRINSIAPDIHWSNLGTAVSCSTQQRREPNGDIRVRAYARTIRISNRLESRVRFIVEWRDPEEETSVKEVLRNGAVYEFSANGDGIHTDLSLEPGTSEELSLVHQRSDFRFAEERLMGRGRVFLRRRLSELRDNYISKSQALTACAAALRRRLS